MKITIDKFTGELPLIHKSKLPLNFSSKACNVNFNHNTLAPMRSDREVHKIKSDYCEIYNGVIHEYKRLVFTAKMRHFQDLVFSTGLLPYPAVADCVNYDKDKLKWGRLGVPQPKDPPRVLALSHIPKSAGLDLNVQNNIIENLDPRCYAFSYENWLGHEGKLSPPSKLVTVKDGESVTIHGFKMPKAEYRIKKINIYRSVATSTTIQDASSKSVWLWCGQINTDWKADYVDKCRLLDLGRPALTETHDGPPDNLLQLICVNDTILAGFYNHRYIRLSECFNPFAFPLYKEIISPYPILRLQPLNNDIIVFTTNGNYKLADVTNGSDQHVLIPYGDKHKLINHDILDCCIVTSIGILWVSQEGIMLTTQSGQINITSNFFTAKDFMKLKPDTMKLGFYHGLVFFTSITHTYMLGLAGSSNNSNGDSYLVQLDIYPDYYLDAVEAMYYVKDKVIYHYEGGNTYKSYSWVSAPINIKSNVNFGVLDIKLANDEGYFVVYLLDDSYKCLFSKRIGKSSTIRLPLGCNSDCYYLACEGTKELLEVTLATSYKELQ